MTDDGSLLDSNLLPCGVIKVTKARDIVYCNQYASDLLTEPPPRIVGRPLKTCLSAASNIFVESYVYPLLLNDTVANEIQITLRTHDGQRAPVVTNIALQDDGSTLWTFMACDNRNTLYDELLDARDTLSKQASELTLLNAEIERKHDDLQVFCHSLTHDFTAPIRRAQQMIIYLVHDLEFKGISPTDKVSSLKNAGRGLAKLTSLVTGLLEFLSADADDYQTEAVDLNDIVSASLELCKEQDGRPINVTVDPLPTVAGSVAQLQVVFKNLIGNAIKYNEKTPELVVTCDTTGHDGYCIVALKDNGIGMSAEYIDQIFEPFKRLHGDSAYSGSGLGLSIVRKLVTKHGGDITVESAPGDGSTFFVKLPVGTV